MNAAAHIDPFAGYPSSGNNTRIHSGIEISKETNKFTKTHLINFAKHGLRKVNKLKNESKNAFMGIVYRKHINDPQPSPRDESRGVGLRRERQGSALCSGVCSFPRGSRRDVRFSQWRWCWEGAWPRLGLWVERSCVWMGKRDCVYFGIRKGERERCFVKGSLY